MADDEEEGEEGGVKLSLKCLSDEKITMALIEGDLNQLVRLVHSGYFIKSSLTNCHLLKQALTATLKSFDSTKPQELRNMIKRRFVALILTILPPSEFQSDEDTQVVREVIDFILMVGFLTNKTIDQSMHRYLMKAACYTAGVLYHFLDLHPLSKSSKYLVRAFRFSVNYRQYSGAKNLLYLVADMPRCTLAYIVSSSYSEQMLPLALAMIDIGIFCFHKNCADDDRPIDRKFDKLISKVKENPLSLQQLTRLKIRGLMKNVEVVKDCYKLPIPKLLQDYISLRFINPPIINQFFPGNRRLNYDITYDIRQRYGIDYSDVTDLQSSLQHFDWFLQDDLDVHAT